MFIPPISFLKPLVPELNQLIPHFEEIIASGMLTKEKYNSLFEDKLTEYLGVKHVVLVSSATTGLILTLLSLDITGEVLVPSFTFCATANAIVRAGATPVFVDCKPGTYTLCPEDAKRKITSKTQAIMPVHVFGVPADVYAIEHLAKLYNLKVVYDSAHAFGSELDGKRIGKFGDAEIFSMTPTKTLTTGEGGIIATENESLAKKIRILKEYGNDGNYNNPYVGINGRISEMQCVIGIYSLKQVNYAREQRNRIAHIMREILCDIPGLELQHIPVNTLSTYKDISIVIDKDIFGKSRDDVEQRLQSMGIPTRKYFYPTLHNMEAFAKYRTSNLPVSERIAASVLCLPLYPTMKTDIAKIIAKAIYKLRHA